MRVLLTFLVTALLMNATAQLTTSSGSPSSLVQNVLIGPGVTVSNINFSGSGGAIGQFNGASSNIGLANGIVMTTGTIANNGDGPQGPNNQNNSGYANGYGGYGLLNNLLTNGIQTYNATVLEFDFVPLSDTVQFRYVFGSEEYLEYAETDFNDVFGFFISGPGISGMQNIARLPNGSPVAINNVHGAGVNVDSQSFGAEFGSLYVDNIGGATVQYDGFTKPLTAISKVQCGEKYHIIIAIADANDEIYDSGIFLEANSFKSPSLVTIDYNVSKLYFGQKNIMAEGCTNATVTLTRQAYDISMPMVISLNATGTASEGVDYSNIPSSVTIPANQTQVTIPITAFLDAIAEGQETIDLNFGIPDPCSGSNQTTIHLIIQDVEPLTLVVSDAEVMCEGESATLNSIVAGGTGTYTYLWNTGETTSSITKAPTITTNYILTVHEECQNMTASDTGEILVPDFDPITLNTSPDTANPCPFIPYTFFVEAHGGAGDYTYQWYDEFGISYGTASTQYVKPGKSTTFYIEVTDRCGETKLDSVTVTVTSPPLVPNVYGDTTICFGDSALLTATATGGWGDHFFYWPLTGDTASSVWFNSRHTQNIYVQVEDDCHTFYVQDYGTVEVLRPIANFVVSSHTVFNNLPITFHNTTYGGTKYQWDFGDGNSSELVNPNNTYDVPGTYYITLYAQNDIGCRDSVTKPITIKPEAYLYIPNSFTPNGDGVNDLFEVSTVNFKQLNISIFDRWGERIYSSDKIRFQWDGSYKGVMVQDGVYVYKVHAVSINGDIKKITGHVVVLK